MLLLKIDPTSSLAEDVAANIALPAAHLLELIQIRRDRELGINQVARGVVHAQQSRPPSVTLAGSSEYRDDDLISVLTLGEEFLVFASDDGPSPYLFRILVEADRISGALTGGQTGSGELSVARFAANGVLTWIPLPRVIRATTHETAGQLGATNLGPVECTELPRGGNALRLLLRSGAQMSNSAGNLLSLDLSPPMVGDTCHWEARKYSWNESDRAYLDRLDAQAVNDNQTLSLDRSEVRS